MRNIVIITLLVIITSCVYNTKKEELPEPINNGGGGSNIPTITYTQHVKNIIDTKCVVCHSSSGTGQPPFLTNYSEVLSKKTRIQARAIDNSPSAMPPSGPLAQDLKDTLQMWLDQGTLQ